MTGQKQETDSAVCDSFMAGVWDCEWASPEACTTAVNCSNSPHGNIPLIRPPALYERDSVYFSDDLPRRFYSIAEVAVSGRWIFNCVLRCFEYSPEEIEFFAIFEWPRHFSINIPCMKLLSVEFQRCIIFSSFIEDC